MSGWGVWVVGDEEDEEKSEKYSTIRSFLLQKTGGIVNDKKKETKSYCKEKAG